MQPSSSAAAQDSTPSGTARKFGPWAHFFFATVLLVASVILIAVNHGDGLEKDLDFVTLYSYTKAVPDRSKALTAISETARQNSWINDKDDAKHCLDMSYFQYPRVSFFPENDPTGPACQIIFNVVNSLVSGQVSISQAFADPTSPSNCKPGKYPLRVTGGSGHLGLQPYLTILAASGSVTSATVNATAPFLTIGEGSVLAPNATLVLSTTGSIGYDFSTYSKGFEECRKYRRDLAAAIHSSTSCEHAGSSPLCQCVREFTSKLTNWNSKLRASYTPTLMLEDVLVKGVGRCVDLKRPHDVRKAVANPYARSSALIVFALALFFNALLSALGTFQWWVRWPMLAQSGFLFVYGLCVFLGALLDADSGVSEYGVVLAVVLPAFLVHGAYSVRLNSHYDNLGVREEPYLHPVTFDLCLCALTLFTLVERGVVQHEYLIVEIFKCHAVAAIYIAVTWFHRFGGGFFQYDKNEHLASDSVQQAYLTLLIVALGAACAPMVVPYPAKKCFEMHWLLPGAFTYLALSNPSWSHSLQIPAKLNTGATIRGFNEVAGILALLFGGVLWGYFLQDHIQIYGSAHFPYPSVRDPLAPVTMRVL